MLLASDYDKSKYLKATDLEREKKYRIKAVTPEELKDNTGKTDKKLVLWFTNSEQGLVLNKTNLRTLKGAFGDDTAGWVQKVIAIYPMMADNGKPGLRIRILPPKATATQASGNGAAAAPPQQKQAITPSGNGAVPATPSPAVASAAVVDPELAPTSVAEDLDDEIPF
jgi:hypothetical protein